MLTGLRGPVRRHRTLTSPTDIDQRVQLLQGEGLCGGNKQRVSGIDRELGNKAATHSKLLVIDQHAVHILGCDFCASKYLTLPWLLVGK